MKNNDIARQMQPQKGGFFMPAKNYSLSATIRLPAHPAKLLDFYEFRS